MAATQVDFLLAGLRDANGDPLNAGLVYTYFAGTTTKQTAWLDKDHVSAAANPVVLNSTGQYQLYCDGWYKFVVKDSAGTTLYTWDNLAFSPEISEWSIVNYTLTYMSATQFTIAGNLTAVFTTGARIKALVTAGTLYGTVSSSAYTSLTTVNVTWDSGGLDAGLSAVYIGQYAGYITTSQYTTVAQALAVGKPLLITNSLTLGANVTTAVPISCLPGIGMIVQGAAYTLTVGASFDAGLYKVFSGFSSGQVVFGSGTVSEIYPEWWGGGPGATAAVNASVLSIAGACKTKIACSRGTWAVSSNLVFTDVPLIYGINGRTIFQPTAAVTGTFIDIETTAYAAPGWTYRSVLKDIEVDGTLTTDVTGIAVGLTAGTADVHLEGVEAYGFKVGLRIADVVGFTTDRCSFTKNGENVRSQYVSAIAYPTRVTLRDTNMSLAKLAVTSGTGVGLAVQSGDVTVEGRSIIESNDKEGVKILTTASNETPIVTLNRPWMESNQASEGTPSSYYHITATDAGTGGVTLRIINPWFGASTVKSASLNNIKFEIKNAFRGAAAGWRFANYCVGTIEDNTQLYTPDWSAYYTFAESPPTSVVRMPSTQLLSTVAEMPLSSTTVSFAADGQTLLYTVPTGISPAKRLVLTKAVVVAAADCGATVVKIGGNAGYDDFLGAQTLSNVDAQYDAAILQPVPNATPVLQKSYAAAAPIYISVSSHAGAAGNIVHLYGILY
jgi:hypothetical protein